MASSTRRVSVKFSAEIQGFKSAMEDAARSTQKVKQASEDSSKAADTYLGKLVQSANKNRDEWEKTGTVLLGVGTAVVGGLALAGKAAMSWESAWAGVNKTVDGSPKQMAELEKELRGLAKTLPATHEEIAGVAEAAGQLGIQRENVVAFTKTMIDLGESTNLSAEEAATGLARFSNVMGTSQGDASRLGSTLVGLGNNFATTESEILAMSMRLAGAGKQAGLSEGEVMGLAAAMSSVGIEAEAGGSAMSITMKRIGKAVEEGGSSLDLFAKTSGMSSSDFQKAWKDDASGALTAFIAGLSETEAMGMSTNAVLTELGITGIREADALLRLSSASDVVTSAFARGNTEFAANTALLEEAAKRYETTESKVKIAWNNIKDAAIDAGAVLLPIIAGVVESVAGVAQAFGNLPGPVKGVLTVLGGVVGVAALGAGAFLTLTPKILDSVQAFNKLAPAGGKAATALGKVGKAAGVAGALATVTLIAAKLAESGYMSKIDTGMGRVASALAEVSTSGPGASRALDELFKDRDGGDLIGDVTDLESAIARTFRPDAGRQFNDWGEAVVNGMSGVKGSSHILAESFERLDAGLADLVSSGKTNDASKSFEQIKKAAEDQGVSVEELAKKFPQYADALAEAEAASKTAAAEGKNLDGSLTDAGKAAETAAKQSEEIEKALEDVGIAADGTITDLDKFVEALGRAGLLQLSTRDAARNYEAALDALDEAIAANGLTLDTSTEKGRANEAAFDAISNAGLASAQAMARSGEGQDAIQGKLQGTYGDLIKAAEKFGITGKEAEDLARKVLGVPDGVSIDSWMATTAKTTAEQTKGAIDAIPKLVVIEEKTFATRYEAIVKTQGQDAANAFVDNSGMGSLKKATGGRLPGFAFGGKLPTSGPGTDRTDGFLGISSAGMPLARVDAGEWIINPDSSNRFNRELAAINAGTFPKLPGYADGGRAREFSAQQLGHTPYRSDGAPSRGGMTIEKVEINEQSDPAATFAEFTRRTSRLGT